MGKTAAGRNNSIDLFRLFCAVLVVACHADLFADVNETLYHITMLYIPRFTVAFFLAVPAYYYISALLEGKASFKPQFLGVLKVYLQWTAIYYIISFFLSVVIGDVPLRTFLWERVVYFFTDGSFYHFWFFPALLYSMLFVTLAYRLFGEKGICALAVLGIVFHLLGAFTTVYYAEIGSKIPVLSAWPQKAHFNTLIQLAAVGFPGYTAGYFVYKARKLSLRIASPRTADILLAVVSICYLAETCFLGLFRPRPENHKVFFFAWPIVVAILLSLQNHPVPGLEKQSAYAKKTAGFMYYVHPLVLLGVQMISGFLGYTIHSVPLFLVTMAIIFLAAEVCIRWENPVTLALLGMGRKRK